VSSAILYGAIVVIWAGVLIPRWLRREASGEESGSATEVGATSSSSSASSASASSAVAEEARDRPLGRDAEHARVIGARRRLLCMLLALATGACVLAYTKLAAWWVVLPPGVMLIGYLALLREASRADAERRSAAPAARSSAPAARSPAPAAPVPVPPPDAEVIDITARVNDDLYDQVADAKLRAVGD